MGYGPGLLVPAVRGTLIVPNGAAATPGTVDILNSTVVTPYQTPAWIPPAEYTVAHPPPGTSPTLLSQRDANARQLVLQTPFLRTLIGDARDLFIETVYGFSAGDADAQPLNWCMDPWPAISCVPSSAMNQSFVHIGRTADALNMLEALAPGGDLFVQTSTGTVPIQMTPDGPLIDADGYIYCPVTWGGNQHLIVVGGSDCGTFFGVAAFLHDEANVRWLYPGRLGTIIPPTSRFSASASAVDAPDYRSRTLVGFAYSGYTYGELDALRKWQLCNRLRPSDTRSTMATATGTHTGLVATCLNPADFQNLGWEGSPVGAPDALLLDQYVREDRILFNQDFHKYLSPKRPGTSRYGTGEACVKRNSQYYPDIRQREGMGANNGTSPLMLDARFGRLPMQSVFGFSRAPEMPVAYQSCTPDDGSGFVSCALPTDGTSPPCEGTAGEALSFTLIVPGPPEDTYDASDKNGQAVHSRFRRVRTPEDTYDASDKNGPDAMTVATTLEVANLSQNGNLYLGGAGDGTCFAFVVEDSDSNALRFIPRVNLCTTVYGPMEAMVTPNSWFPCVYHQPVPGEPAIVLGTLGGGPTELPGSLYGGVTAGITIAVRSDLVMDIARQVYVSLIGVAQRNLDEGCVDAEAAVTIALDDGLELWCNCDYCAVTDSITWQGLRVELGTVSVDTSTSSSNNYAVGYYQLIRDDTSTPLSPSAVRDYCLRGVIQHPYETPVRSPNTQSRRVVDLANGIAAEVYSLFHLSPPTNNGFPVGSNYPLISFDAYSFHQTPPIFQPVPYPFVPSDWPSDWPGNGWPRAFFYDGSYVSTGPLYYDAAGELVPRPAVPPEPTTLSPYLIPFISGQRDGHEYGEPYAPAADFASLLAQSEDKLRLQPDQFNIERWSLIATQLGLYEYLYGGTAAGFLAPRIYSSRLATGLASAHAMNARAFLAETYPHWGLDGPKYYVAARALWNVSDPLGPAGILSEYCQALVSQIPLRMGTSGGTSALIEQLSNFFLLLESTWTAYRDGVSIDPEPSTSVNTGEGPGFSTAQIGRNFSAPWAGGDAYTQFGMFLDDMGEVLEGFSADSLSSLQASLASSDGSRNPATLLADAMTLLNAFIACMQPLWKMRLLLASGNNTDAASWMTATPFTFSAMSVVYAYTTADGMMQLRNYVHQQLQAVGLVTWELGSGSSFQEQFCLGSFAASEIPDTFATSAGLLLYQGDLDDYTNTFWAGDNGGVDYAGWWQSNYSDPPPRGATIGTAPGDGLAPGTGLIAWFFEGIKDASGANPGRVHATLTSPGYVSGSVGDLVSHVDPDDSNYSTLSTWINGDPVSNRPPIQVSGVQYA